MGTTRRERRQGGSIHQLDRALDALLTWPRPTAEDQEPGLDPHRQVLLEACDAVDAAFLQAMGDLGLAEASMALARHLETDGDRWRRILGALRQDACLSLSRSQQQTQLFDGLVAHFRRWESATHQGDRLAQFQAAWVMATFRTAFEHWVQGSGRPALPLLVEEGLAALWPALFPRLRRIKT